MCCIRSIDVFTAIVVPESIISFGHLIIQRTYRLIYPIIDYWWCYWQSDFTVSMLDSAGDSSDNNFLQLLLYSESFATHLYISFVFNTAVAFTFFHKNLSFLSVIIMPLFAFFVVRTAATASACTTVRPYQLVQMQGRSRLVHLGIYTLQMLKVCYQLTDSTQTTERRRALPGAWWLPIWEKG